MAITSIDIVVSKYKEDTSWIKQFTSQINPIVYDKSGSGDNSLPNTGREGHTYLHHILSRWDSLSDYTVFCQGNPFDHCENFFSIMNTLSINERLIDTGFYSLGTIVSEGPYGNFDKRHECGLPMFYWLDFLFGISMNPSDKYRTVYGAQFVVHKSNILNRPQKLYKILYHILSQEKDPIEGYIIERLWPYLLDKNIQLSKKCLNLLQEIP
jgi:hypothetical protein